MKRHRHNCLILLSASCLLGVPSLVAADNLTLLTGRCISGTVIQTNGGSLLLLTDYGTFRYGIENLKKIEIDQAKPLRVPATNELPDLKSIVLLLSRQAWASDLEPIPTTPVERGMLRHVPRVSFRCADDYMVNIYGDLEHPAGVEVGVYRKLFEDTSARRNCLKLTNDLLSRAGKETLQTLSLQKDVKTRDGLTFEITTSEADDEHMGWWVSVYSEPRLYLARAGDEEAQQIRMSVSKADVAKGSDWRPALLNKIVFTNKSGIAIKDPELVPLADGVSPGMEGAEGLNAAIMRRQREQWTDAQKAPGALRLPAPPSSRTQQALNALK